MQMLHVDARCSCGAMLNGKGPKQIMEPFAEGFKRRHGKGKHRAQVIVQELGEIPGVRAGGVTEVDPKEGACNE